MFWLFNDDKPWFRPKSFGFGAGLPIAWQGWALLAAHTGVLVELSALLRDHPAALVAAILTGALLPMPLYAARTEGGWHWRWKGGK